MKRTIIIFLILSICVALFACNRTENDESSDKPKDESSAFVDDSSTVIDESAEPIVVENVPASQLMSMDKNSIVSYSDSMFGMISGSITEIPEEFFYPESDGEFPSPDDRWFSVMSENIEVYVDMAADYDIFTYSEKENAFASENNVLNSIRKDSGDFNNALEKYREFYTSKNYDDAALFLRALRSRYRAVEDRISSSIIKTSRALTGDMKVLNEKQTYHPEMYIFEPYHKCVDNEKNSVLSRKAIEWVYGYSSMTGSQGAGYAAALYPYGTLSICRYPGSGDVFDDLIMVNTTLPIYNMNIPETAGSTALIFEDYRSILQDGPIYAERSRFRVRPNCAFDSAEILPIDEENEEVTFVLYDENGDEIKRITFNYMTYVFRETYPA